MIIQAGYDFPCKYYIGGVYSDSDSDSEDEQYDNHPTTSGPGKSSPPIKIDMFKTDDTSFCR